MIRAHSRAFALSTTPGKRRHSSMAAESSPSSLKTARMAAASASVTANMARPWASLARLGKPGAHMRAHSHAISCR